MEEETPSAEAGEKAIKCYKSTDIKSQQRYDWADLTIHSFFGDLLLPPRRLLLLYDDSQLISYALSSILGQFGPR